MTHIALAASDGEVTIVTKLKLAELLNSPAADSKLTDIVVERITENIVDQLEEELFEILTPKIRRALACIAVKSVE